MRLRSSPGQRSLEHAGPAERIFEPDPGIHALPWGPRLGVRRAETGLASCERDSALLGRHVKQTKLGCWRAGQLTTSPILWRPRAETVNPGPPLTEQERRPAAAPLEVVMRRAQARHASAAGPRTKKSGYPWLWGKGGFIAKGSACGRCGAKGRLHAQRKVRGRGRSRDVVTLPATCTRALLAKRPPPHRQQRMCAAEKGRHVGRREGRGARDATISEMKLDVKMLLETSEAGRDERGKAMWHTALCLSRSAGSMTEIIVPESTRSQVHSMQA